jgi:hypothetical protein
VPDTASRELLATWQKRLGLQDWAITLELRDPLLFTDCGQVNWDGDVKRAVITLRAGDEDAEATLVHELLHLHFVDCVIALNILEPFLGSIALEVARQNMRVGIERAVEKLTTALVPS